MPIATLFAALLVAAPQVTTPAAAVATSTIQLADGTPIRPTTRVCFRNERAGSIMPAKICRSYAQWKRDGIDPALARRIR